MLSVGRAVVSRVAVRAAASTAAGSNISSAVKDHLFSALKAQQPMIVQTSVRTFAAQTFLDPAEVTARIIDVVKNFDQVDANKVTDKVKFTDDLGLDSLDVVEVVMAIEDEFAIEIPDAEADKIVSIADAVEYITSHPMAK
jgi:NADH dehydrogenase (ubiquinone) 1 alpha/beta subcomplex 1